jgi:hypothetical protein
MLVLVDMKTNMIKEFSTQAIYVPPKKKLVWKFKKVI